MEKKIRNHFPKQDKVFLIRYCDDMIVTGANPQILIEAQSIIRDFLHIRGLTLSEEKTHITDINQGFNFLGQNIRKYKDKKVLTKPSKENIKNS